MASDANLKRRSPLYSSMHFCSHPKSILFGEHPIKLEGLHFGWWFSFHSVDFKPSTFAIDGEITDLGWQARLCRRHLKESGDHFQGIVKPFSIASFSRVMRWELCMVNWIGFIVGMLRHVQGYLHIYQRLMMEWNLDDPTSWLHDRCLGFGSAMVVDGFGWVSHTGRIRAGWVPKVSWVLSATWAGAQCC